MPRPRTPARAISGLEIAWDREGPLRGAALYMYVPDSSIATRDGLNVYDVRVRWHPLASAPNAWLQGEYAWQRRSSVAARGWYAALNYNAKDVRVGSRLRCCATRGSPATSPAPRNGKASTRCTSAAAIPTGTRASSAARSSTTRILRASLRRSPLTPVERNLRAGHCAFFRAVETNAPLAVPDPNQPRDERRRRPRAKALANEVDAIWTYTASKQVNVNVFAAYGSSGSRVTRTFYCEQGRIGAVPGADSELAGRMSTIDEAFEGGCTCRPRDRRDDVAGRGAVRALLPLPLVPARVGFSAFVLNAMIVSARTGRGCLAGDVDVVIRHRSAVRGGQEVARCPRCRVAVWSNYAGAGEFVLRACWLLDDPDRLPSDCTSSRCRGSRGRSARRPAAFAEFCDRVRR